jgi:hypothetical protein
MTPIVKVMVAVMVLGLVAQAHGQQQDRDTTHAMRIELLEPGLDSGGAVFFIPPHLAVRPAFPSAALFFEGVPTAGGAGLAGRGFEVKQDLLAPLRAQWAREAETKTFRMIMGSIQFGGVAFLAVRQLTGAGIMTAKPRPVRSQRK